MDWMLDLKTRLLNDEDQKTRNDDKQNGSKAWLVFPFYTFGLSQKDPYASIHFPL